MKTLWNQSYARRSLMPRDRTMNPTPAAASLLGIKARRVTRHQIGQSVRRLLGKRRRPRTGNPVPAALAVGALGSLGGISKRLQGPAARAAERERVFREWSRLALLGDKDSLARLREYASRTGRYTRVPEVGRVIAQTVLVETDAQLRAATGKGAPATLGAAAGSMLDPTLVGAGTKIASEIGREVVRGATRRGRGRSRSRRVLEGYDEFGEPVYRTVRSRASRAPRASTAGIPGGAVRTAAGGAGLATSVGAASGAAVAGVVIGGLAVGLLIGTGLRKVFGEARAVRAEEAAVQGALVLRNTRAQLEAQLGRKLNQTETRAMFAEYTAQLQRLGFTQDDNGQWRRKRGALERLLG